MVRTSMTGPMWKPWVPLTHRMGPRDTRAQSGREPNLRRRNRDREPKKMNLGYLQPWDRSHHRPKGFPRRPEYPVGQDMSTSLARSAVWRPWPGGHQDRRLWDESTSPEAPPDVSSARVKPVKGRHFRAYRSRLWRPAQKVPRPLTTPFAKLWKPLFLMLRVLCNVMVKHCDAPDPTVERFFNAVAVMSADDIH